MVFHSIRTSRFFIQRCYRSTTFRPRPPTLVSGSCSNVLQIHLLSFRSTRWKSNNAVKSPHHPHVLSSFEDIQQLLDIDEMKSLYLIKKHPKVQYMARNQLIERIAELEAMSIPLHRIRLMPWLLYMQLDKIKLAAEDFERGLGLQFLVAIAFTHLRAYDRRRLILMWKMKDTISFKNLNLACKNRIHYFSKHLRCTDIQVSDMMAKVSRLATLQIERIHEHMIVLQSGKVPSVYIVEDPWIFLHNLDLIKDRLAILQSLSIGSVKPWTLRATEIIFDLHLKHRKDEMDLKNEVGTTIDHVLVFTLGCTQEETEAIKKKCALLMRSKPTTVQSRLQALFNLGYTKEEIKAGIFALTRRTALISSRFSYLKELGCEKPPLHVLYKNSIAFDVHVHNIISANDELEQPLEKTGIK